MAHSFRAHYFHLVWSTRNREPFIIEEIRCLLYAYIGGVIKNHNGKLLEAGGMPDHIHLLVGLKSPDDFSKLIRDIKTSSSLWINKNAPEKHFAWQDGYGSFSVSYSSLDKVKLYIKNQEHHHKTSSFDKEYLQLLNLHNIDFDSRFVLG
jgi:putative transposase